MSRNSRISAGRAMISSLLNHRDKKSAVQALERLITDRYGLSEIQLEARIAHRSLTSSLATLRLTDRVLSEELSDLGSVITFSHRVYDERRKAVARAKLQQHLGADLPHLSSILDYGKTAPSKDQLYSIAKFYSSNDPLSIPQLTTIGFDPDISGGVARYSLRRAFILLNIMFSLPPSEQKQVISGCLRQSASLESYLEKKLAPSPVVCPDDDFVIPPQEKVQTGPLKTSRTTPPVSGVQLPLPFTFVRSPVREAHPRSALRIASSRAE